ncbi:Arrestin or S-antigen, domain-containing protein [Cladophialophora immunda]|nr:Arrestin or S-antigen, domain-containing protein [Cladophialophora immunda]
MALKFLSAHTPHSGSSSSVKYFDIRLDNDYIVFRGNEDEAASAQLSGSLVLCLTEPMTIHHVDLTLSGILHMSWQTTSTSSMSGRRTTYKEKTFFEKNWTFRDPGKGKTEVLQPDNYEWPFRCILEGSLPESVEGLKDAWIIYRLKAEISRKRGRDIVVRKPLRIVRTLDSNALELSHAMSVENIWPNKIEYSISIPNKAVAFGSFVQVDFKLISLLKGLVIGNVSTQVKEEQEFVVDPEWGISALNNGQTKTDRVIASDLYKVNPENDEQIIDEVAEGYQFSRYLELPKSLNQCLQDCNVKGIKVRHKVKFNVQLHNPDGHISELRANLPVSFYISPSLPINENNDLVDQSPQAGRAAIANDLANAAPPVYGKHTLDVLYSDVDGYRTPGTALSTPGTPYLHSRHASHENLASLAAMANGNYVSPIALQSRLQDLRVGDSFIQDLRSNEDSEISNLSLPVNGRSRRNSSSTTMPEDYFAPHDASNASPHPRVSPNDQGACSGGPSHTPSQPGSLMMSRRTSEEEEGQQSGARTPFPQYDHMEDLARVPSYTTAVKTPAPRTQFDQSIPLPTYGAAVTDPSPPPLAEPPTAHLRTSPRLPGTITVTANSPDSPVNSVPRTSISHRNVSSIQDDERRLRMMQLRGR